MSETGPSTSPWTVSSPEEKGGGLYVRFTPPHTKNSESYAIKSQCQFFGDCLWGFVWFFFPDSLKQIQASLACTGPRLFDISLATDRQADRRTDRQTDRQKQD